MAVSTGKAYSLATAEEGALPYIDRTYEITGVSEGLDGGVLVRTANDDKYGQAEDHLRLHLNAEGIVYVGYDKRSVTIESEIGEVDPRGFRSIALPLHKKGLEPPLKIDSLLRDP